MSLINNDWASTHVAWTHDIDRIQMNTNNGNILATAAAFVCRVKLIQKKHYHSQCLLVCAVIRRVNQNWFRKSKEFPQFCMLSKCLEYFFGSIPAQRTYLCPLAHRASCRWPDSRFCGSRHSRCLDAGGDRHRDTSQPRTNLPSRNDQCVGVVVVRHDSICRAMTVSCVHRCLERVNLCHRCNHDRGWNGSEDGHEESTREKGRDQQDRNARDVVVRWVWGRLRADGGCQWGEWASLRLATGYRYSEGFCCLWDKLLGICYWLCKDHRVFGWRVEYLRWGRENWSHRRALSRSHLLSCRRRLSKFPTSTRARRLTIPVARSCLLAGTSSELVARMEDLCFRCCFRVSARNLQRHLILLDEQRSFSACKPPGLGTWLVPRLGPGSTKQFDVFLAYRSKSGSKIVPSGPDLVASIFSDDNWHVPFPRAEILGGKMRSNPLCYELRSASTYPNANVLHSESPRQMLRHLSSTFVSVRLKVLSNGSIAPKAIRSKQSEKSKVKKIIRDVSLPNKKIEITSLVINCSVLIHLKTFYDSQTKQRTCVVWFSAGFFPS